MIAILTISVAAVAALIDYILFTTFDFPEESKYYLRISIFSIAILVSFFILANYDARRCSK